MERAVVANHPRQLEWDRWCPPELEGLLREVVEPLAASLTEQLGPPAYSRVYFGNESCEIRLPEPAALSRMLEAAQQRGLALTLLTPQVNDACLEKVEQLLDLLPGGSEVVCNDWGVLGRVRQRPLKPILGRLLSRCLRDPRSPEHPAWGASPLAHPHFRQALAGWGVERVEVDVPLGPVAPAAPEWGSQASLRAPFVHVASGRVCAVGSLSAPPEDKFQTAGACQRECLTYLTRLDSPTLESQLFHRGNAAFAVAEATTLAATLAGFSRLVFDPELLF